jgi:predicted transcriptional regulator
MNATQIFKARLPRELTEKMDAIVARLDSSRDTIVQHALDAWVREEERRHSLALPLADFRPGPAIGDGEHRPLARIRAAQKAVAGDDGGKAAE